MFDHWMRESQRNMWPQQKQYIPRSSNCRLSQQTATDSLKERLEHYVLMATITVFDFSYQLIILVIYQLLSTFMLYRNSPYWFSRAEIIEHVIFFCVQNEHHELPMQFLWSSWTSLLSFLPHCLKFVHIKWFTGSNWMIPKFL